MAENTTHIGKKISRLRELRGMKQETLAEQLGISQQAVSKMEQSEQVEDLTLERVAKALGIRKEAIENFNDEALIFHIENMHDQSSAYNQNYNHQCTFHPLDEIRKLNADKEELYKALLKEKEEKIALLEKMISDQKK